MTNATETLTLTDFLLARIAEDEAAARAATPGPWATVIPHEWSKPMDGELLVRTSAGRDYWEALVTPAGGEHGDDGLRGPDAQHIARHDPARVLAECEAKRRIVRLHSPDHTCTDGGRNYPGVFSGALDGFEVCLTLRALAAVYSDHPDYRADWP